MSSSMSPVDCLYRKDGIRVYEWMEMDHPDLWSMINDKLQKQHEGVKIKPHIYYCQRCNKVFILPPWFTSYFMPDKGTNYNCLDFLQKHLKCCKSPLIFILLRDQDLKSSQEEIGMIFLPFRPQIVWVIPDEWAHTTIVSEQLL